MDTLTLYPLTLKQNDSNRKKDLSKASMQHHLHGDRNPVRQCQW